MGNFIKRKQKTKYMNTEYIYPKDCTVKFIYQGLDCDWQAQSVNGRIRAFVLAVSIFLISMVHSFEGVCRIVYSRRKVCVAMTYPPVIDVTDKFDYIEIDEVKCKATRVLHNLIDNTYEVEINQMPYEK
jgi:hypothetical protein